MFGDVDADADGAGVGTDVDVDTTIDVGVVAYVGNDENMSVTTAVDGYDGGYTDVVMLSMLV